MRIYKYPLEVTDRQVVRMPSWANMLSVQLQHGKLQLWALVDETKNTTQDITIAIYGTGNPMPDDPGTYISTFQLSDGDLVFHAFCLDGTITL